jgi:putative transcriptional regulator
MYSLEVNMIDSLIIGERIKQYRLNQNLSQMKIAKLSGLSRNAIQKAEKGSSALDTYIAIMKALGRIEALEAAFPEESISPVQLVERKSQKRLRASPQRNQETSVIDNKELDW